MSTSDLQNDSEFSKADRSLARQPPVAPTQHAQGDGESGRRGDVPRGVKLNGVVSQEPYVNQQQPQTPTSMASFQILFDNTTCYDHRPLP